MRKLLLLLSVLSLLFAYGCGAEDVLTLNDSSGSSEQDSNMTAVNFDNDSTLRGTYKIVYARVSCSNSVEVESTDILTSSFKSYYAYDGLYSYFDLYLKYAGNVILDEAEKTVGSISVADYITTIEQTSPYNFRVYYNNVPVGGGVTCSERFDFMKLSDSIRSQYFRVMTQTVITDPAKDAEKLPFFPVPLNVLSQQ